MAVHLNETDGSFASLKRLGISSDALRLLALLLPGGRVWLENINQALQRFSDSVDEKITELLKAPRVEGYEQHFIRGGLTPLGAQIMTQITLRQGPRHHAETLANRALASAVGELVRQKEASALVISRRAKRLANLLKDGMGSPQLRDAFRAAGIAEEEDAFTLVVSDAAPRSPDACARLTAICERLKPHLADPRGRMLRVQSATHELLLLSFDRPVTLSGSMDCYEDPATKGTRQAFDDYDFDPRPALRRIRTRMKR
jgi:hypothetical protein